MTQEDFIYIIYESFDHLPALLSFLKKKRKDVKCIRSEYAFGLTMAFKTINDAVNQRDYNHIMFTKPDGETIEYELEAGHHAEQIFHLQTSENLKGAKTSFPNKIVIDLRRITNGRFKGILTAAHMEQLSPILDAYLRTIEPVIEQVTENTKKLPQQNLITKYESEFFKITESLCYEFNEDLGLTFDTFNDELFSNIDKFKAEIIENITNLNQSDRGFYLKRILERLKKNIGTTIQKNKKTGDEYSLIIDASIDKVHTFEGNELERYYRMSNIYKNQMINFISELIVPATKTTIIGSIGNELNAIRERYRNYDERSETYVKYYKQIDQLTHVKDILTRELIPFDNYFGGYSDRLNNPFVYWNGFYIQPSKITDLTDLITERRIIYNDKFILDINEISEYIFAYKEGFMLGYEKFDSIEVEHKSSVFKSDKLSIEKIINYVENHKESDNGGFTFQFYPRVDNFPFSYSSDGTLSPRVDKIPFSIEECRERQLNGVCSERMLHEQQTGNECHACFPFALPNPNSWKSKGIEGGKYYRAWYVMLANYKYFDEYFRALLPQQTEIKIEQETPKTFEELFYNPKHAEPCLGILRELQPPVIDAINNYIGKAKGVFPLWVRVLTNHKPKPLIKHFKDTVYKDLLNQKIKGLNLTKDASEFRKQYVRLENNKTELDIKTILSQYSQSGKLGK
ncbi:MAG: hypothetical protein M0Q53_01415 [Prolixibacteraceae bacterium]|jgi:hypothetical protein|nr:hypothetical protein [Prolixibacteraceae bacterium]